ncbi:MAG: DUF1467 family protein [Pseudomonadota bacterium]
MTVTGAIVMFVITWWLSFFVVLPIGVAEKVGEGDGTGAQEPGAPVSPQLGKKVRWATIGAAGITALLGASTYILDFETLFLAG